MGCHHVLRETGSDLIIVKETPDCCRVVALVLVVVLSAPVNFIDSRVVLRRTN